MKIAVIGQDNRQKYIYGKLKSLHYDVDFITDNITLNDYDILVLPIPSVTEGKYISATNKLLNTEMLQSLNNTVIIGGNVYDYGFTDVLRREDFKYLNGVPTAEAAISLAILNSKTTLWKSKILITGFGHIGKMLYTRLKNFGTDIDITARSDSDMALIESEGIKPIKTNEIINYIGNYDYIFNTVYKPVFTSEVIKKIKKDATVIELASGNSGFDMEEVRKSEFNFISALGLPNKYSPVTGGDIYLNVILKIIGENFSI